MRILLVALFSLVLAACGEPYSEIEGYKIGKPLEDKTGYEMETHDYYARMYGDFTTYWKSQPKEFFNAVSIIEKNGKVVFVGLERSGSSKDESKKARIKEYVEEFIKTSKDKWGELELVASLDGYSQLQIEIPVSKDEVIGGILLTYSNDYSHATIDYLEREFFYEAMEAEIE